MTVRRTVSLPDDLDQAVSALAGDNFSGFTQRALRNALVARDLDLIAGYSAGAVLEDDVAAAVDVDLDVELAEQERASGRRAS